MTRIGRYANAAMAIDWTPDSLPSGTQIQSVALPTPDHLATTGTLFEPSRDRGPVVALVHPRVDFSRHYLVPGLLRRGIAVWTQRSRYVNNDATAVHEKLLLDVAVAMCHLRDAGFAHIHLLGNSGGASLVSFYIQQAGRAPGNRLSDTPSGAPVNLDVDMPPPSGLVLLAPHPGQGDLLLHCIDPSVADEDDPSSVIPELNLFDPANGFVEPPASSRFDPDFLARYREAQRCRVATIDARMRAILEAKAALRRSEDPAARRVALAASFVTVHRTDADPRTVDLHLDPSQRDYGSIFGRRPDITNYGAIGFGRLTTPEAWLSTWSGLSTRAALRLTAPDVGVPTLLASYTADNSVFPSDVDAIAGLLGTPDLVRADLPADHYGYVPGTEERLEEVAEMIAAWVELRS